MNYTSGQEFLNDPKKAIALIGMSGIGKSYLAAMMQRWGWTGYSCDLEIGTKHLAAEMKKPVTIDDISALSEFIGKIGEMPFVEFKRRQMMYHDAEVAALASVPDMAARNEKFVLDSTGSICEILDEKIIEQVGRSTLIVYIEASRDEEIAILQRAQDYPKPLFYPPRQLEAWVKEYMQICDLDNADTVPSDDFSRWVFPRLFEMRIPKYQNMAECYGVSVLSEDIHKIQSEQDLLNLVAAALDARR